MKNNNFCARIEAKDENILKQVCEITGETKTALFLRLLKNEFNLLTNKPELIANKLEYITERRFQRLFDKLSEFIGDVSKNTKNIDAISRKILGCLLICNRDVHRNYFIISRILYEYFKITKEKIDKYVNRSIVNTGHAMRETIKELDWGLKRISDSFMDMGKNIKNRRLKIKSHTI
jgi:hypothetical protein